MWLILYVWQDGGFWLAVAWSCDVCTVGASGTEGRGRTGRITRTCCMYITYIAVLFNSFCPKRKINKNYLSVFLSVFPSVLLAVCLFLSVSLSVCLSLSYPFLSCCICISVCLSVGGYRWERSSWFSRCNRSTWTRWNSWCSRTNWRKRRASKLIFK